MQARLEGLEYFLRRTIVRWIALPVGVLLVLTLVQSLITVRFSTLSRQREAVRYSLDVIEQHVDSLTRELVRANEIGVLVSASPEEAHRILRTLMNRSGSFEELLLLGVGEERIAELSRDRVILGEETSGLAESGVAEEVRRVGVPVIRPTVQGARERALIIGIPVLDLTLGRVHRVLLGRSSFDHLSTLLSQLPSGREQRVELQLHGEVVAANGLPRNRELRPAAATMLLGSRQQALEIGETDAVIRALPVGLRPLILGTGSVAPFVVVFVVTLVAYMKMLTTIRQQVIRPLHNLGESMSQARIGDRSSEAANIDTFISELRELGERFESMRHRNDEQYISLRQAMEANESLLREVHHRVKNNLQIIKSLLHLQIHALQPDGKETESFKVFEARIGAMALIHQHAQAITSQGKLRLDEYLGDLASDVSGSFYNPERPVLFDVDVPEVYLSFEPATLLGQIVVEALANALRHAFPDGAAECSIALRGEVNDGVMTLTIEDNGVGFDPDLREESMGVGLRIAEILAEDLEGKLAIESGTAGTAMRIQFRLSEKSF